MIKMSFKEGLKKALIEGLVKYRKKVDKGGLEVVSF
jgi:hypothetical protein